MAGTHIDIIAVGRLKERYWTDACAEYRKRLGRYVALSVSEVPDRAARSQAERGLALAAEASALRQRIAPGSHLIVLDSAGVQLTSEGIAEVLGTLQDAGIRRLSFVIGGSWGVDEALKREADLLLSLGAITLPHNLARVLLLEQLYRAFRILTNEPYHK
jgi:23S rRNA (pseudouridine1915-N3)-methyltransferase